MGLSGQEFLQTKSWQLLRAVELDAVDYRAIAARLEERASKKKESVALKERTKTPDEEVTFRPCGPGWWLEVGGALCETIEKSAKAAGVTPEAWLQQVIGVGADGRRLPSLAA